MGTFQCEYYRIINLVFLSCLLSVANRDIILDHFCVCLPLKMFSTATRNFVEEIDDGSLIPVSSLIDSDKLVPLPGCQMQACLDLAETQMQMLTGDIQTVKPK